jgi:hypothetical protein
MSLVNGAGKTCRRLILSPFTSINSEWIIDPNITSEKLKLLQDKIVNTLDHISKGITSIVQLLREMRWAVWLPCRLKAATSPEQFVGSCVWY